MKNEVGAENNHGVPAKNGNRYDLFLVIGGIALLFALIYTIREILSPFLVLFAIIFILFPVRENRIAKNLLLLAVFLFLLWFLYAASGVLAPLIIAFVLTYVFNPIVNWMERHHIRRWVAISIILFGTFGVMVLVSLFFVPIIAEQIGGLISAFPGIVSDANLLLKQKIVPFLSSLGVKRPEQTLVEQVAQHVQVIVKNILDALIGLVTSGSAIVTQLLNIVTVPFLCYYLLKDYASIGESLLALFPPMRRRMVNGSFRKIDEIFGHYVRGAIILAVINGVLASLLLWLVGVNYPLILGMLSGILDLVPYFGLLITLVISVIVALFSNNPLFCIIAVLIIMPGLRLLETTVLMPKFIGHQVGLHPLVMILSLLIFGYFLGFIGLLIAVPATAILLMFLREWMEWRDTPGAQSIEVPSED
jgi:predicted PurR-regulated permease PerM